MPRPARPLRALLTAIILLSSGPLVGCASGPKLEKIEAPAEGIRLRYDLSPGQTYSGSVSHNETVRDARSGMSQNRSLSFDVSLVVAGPAPDRGGHKIVARFSNVNLSWKLPPGLPFSLSDFTNSAKAAIQGMEVDIFVGDDGKIHHIPSVPEGAGPELGMVIKKVLEALETAFLTVPDRPLKIGETWTDEKKRGREGKLGLFVRGSVTTKVDGYYRNEQGEEIARLQINENETAVTTTKDGSHETKKEGKVTSDFSTSGSYLVQTIGELNEYDPGEATTITKLKVTWTKGQRAGVVQSETQSVDDPCSPDYVGSEECNAGGETQSVTDPCDPDYVGSEECTPAGEGGEAAAAGDAG
ncbi:MAG: hypothetical protein H6710_04025 [Myxococcales bacterium]|nr:hypothetical protein [Myxococcales bacterium]MCB9705767.1 hypothetical protein [Myxococcales bacterium]